MAILLLAQILSLMILIFIKLTFFLFVSVFNVINIKVIIIVPCVVVILFIITGTTTKLYGPHINFYCKSRGLFGGLPKMSKYVKYI